MEDRNLNATSSVKTMVAIASFHGLTGARFQVVHRVLSVQVALRRRQHRRNVKTAQKILQLLGSRLHVRVGVRWDMNAMRMWVDVTWQVHLRHLPIASGHVEMLTFAVVLLQVLVSQSVQIADVQLAQTRRMLQLRVRASLPWPTLPNPITRTIVVQYGAADGVSNDPNRDDVFISYDSQACGFRAKRYYKPVQRSNV